MTAQHVEEIILILRRRY